MCTISLASSLVFSSSESESPECSGVVDLCRLAYKASLPTLRILYRATTAFRFLSIAEI